MSKQTTTEYIPGMEMLVVLLSRLQTCNLEMGTDLKLIILKLDNIVSMLDMTCPTFNRETYFLALTRHDRNLHSGSCFDPELSEIRNLI